MMSPYNKFEDVLSLLFSLLGLDLLEPLCRFANRLAQFIFAYRQGLSGTQAAWANKKYYGHHILPPDMIALMKETVPV